MKYQVTGLSKGSVIISGRAIIMSKPETLRSPAEISDVVKDFIDKERNDPTSLIYKAGGQKPNITVTQTIQGKLKMNLFVATLSKKKAFFLLGKKTKHPDYHLLTGGATI